MGPETATPLTDAGTDVGIVGRNAEGVEVTRQAIVGKGRRCLTIALQGPRICSRFGVD
jgi:hypothetical protein